MRKLQILLILCACVLMSPTCQDLQILQHPFLKAPISLPQDGGGHFVAIGDLDEDGIPDFVGSGSKVMINVGNGDGTFTRTELPQLPQLSDESITALEDLNHDHHLDMLVGTSGGHLIVLLGNGDATFQAPTYYQTANYATAILVEDFNEDGHEDVLFVASTASFFRGNGDGTLTFEREVALGSRFAVVADFNHDNHLDVGGSDGNNQVKIFLGNGQGDFTLRSTFAGTGQTYSLTAADINGDQHPDLELGSRAGVKIVLSDGLGNLSAGTTILPEIEDCNHTVADFNSDGINDVAVVGFRSGLLYLMQGLGDGGFVERQTFAVIGSGYCWQVQTADFDDNSKLDFVIVPGNALSLVLAYVDGTYETVRKCCSTTSSLHRILMGDFTNDGIQDMVGYGYSDLICIPGTAGGNFDTPHYTPLDSHPDDIAVGNFNADDFMDIVLIDYTKLDVFVGDGQGNFSLSQRFTDQYYLHFHRIVVEDFNGDGLTDIIAEGSLDINPRTNKLFIFLNNGDGTFAMSDMTVTFTISDFVAYDINGDSVIDLALLNWRKESMAIFLGNGDGSFRYVISHPLLLFPESIVKGDLNRDGYQDLIIDCVNTRIILLGEAQGGFRPLFQPRDWYFGTRSGLLDDVNGDGILDMIFLALDYDIAIKLGLGDGTFEPAFFYGTGGVAEALTTADLDHDGFPEIIAANGGYDCSILTRR